MRTLDFDALPGLFSPLFRRWLREARAAGAVTGDGRCALARSADAIPEPPPSPSRDVRAELCDRLETYSRELGAPEGTLASIARLRDPRACAVLTGQQPGLLGGPLLVAYKTATAIAAARRLEERWGRPVVPVFWNHSDDADVDEIRRVTLIDRENKLHTLECPPAPARTEIGAVAWREELPRLFEESWAMLPQTQFTPAVRALYEGQVHEGPARWFAGLMLRLFGPHGLIVFEPRLARSLWADVLARGAADLPGIQASIAEEEARLRAEGFEPPLAAESAAVLFRVIDGGRRRLRTVGGGVQEDGSNEIVAPEALAATARVHPETFSPGVALRPVCQDRVFPTAAYVGGPAEVSYLTQLRGVYTRLGFRPPVLLPRLSATLIEPKIARVVEKFDLPPEHLFDLAVRIPTMLAQSLPEDVLKKFHKARHDLVLELRDLRGTTLAVDPALERHYRRFAGKVMKGLKELKQRTGAALLERKNVGRSQIEKVVLHLTPKNQPQERVLPLAPYLCLFGTPLVQRILDLAATFPEGHSLVDLG